MIFNLFYLLYLFRPISKTNLNNFQNNYFDNDMNNNLNFLNNIINIEEINISNNNLNKLKTDEELGQLSNFDDEKRNKQNNILDNRFDENILD